MAIITYIRSWTYMKFLFFSGSATNYLEFNIYGFVCCPVAVNKNHNNNINNNYYYNKSKTTTTISRLLLTRFKTSFTVVLGVEIEACHCTAGLGWWVGWWTKTKLMLISLCHFKIHFLWKRITSSEKTEPFDVLNMENILYFHLDSNCYLFLPSSAKLNPTPTQLVRLR